MRVLHINSYYSDHGKPTFYRNFFDAQLKTGLDISVFVPVDHSVDSVMAERFGAYSQVVKTHEHRDRYFYHLKQGKVLKEAIRRYRDEKFDIIHAHSLFTNGYVAWKLSETLGVPYIVAVRNREVNTFFRYMIHLRNTGRRIMADADKVVFISEPNKQLVLNRYTPPPLRESMISKTLVIGNGIDDLWLRNTYRGNRRLEGKELKLLSVGQVIGVKNHLTTAKAAEILIQRGFKVTLTVVGEKKDERIFRKLQEYPFLRYLPPTAKEELIDVYREADIFVLPSITETFGLVYPEAMSQGLPLIYSRGQGFDGQFEEGKVGFHVESRNAEEIADRIVDITGNYEEISRNSVELCTRFNWTDIAREYERVYQKVTARKDINCNVRTFQVSQDQKGI